MIRGPLSRCMFHTSRHVDAKPSKVMGKVMGFAKKKKYYYEAPPILPSVTSLSKGTFEAKITGGSKRSSVLNKLFMRHITDLMATGEYSGEIVGLGIEVNKVKITTDYKILKVYWTANGNERDETIEGVLKKNAGLLRHELSQLRVMGVVPTIVFVKDKMLVNAVELENRLAKADFGEDYVSTDPAEQLKSELELWTTLDSVTKQKIKAQESIEEALEEDLDPLPPMPQNVLGLDRADIMSRVKKALKKSEATHRMNGTSEETTEWTKFKLTQPVNDSPVNYESHKAQRAAFKEFLVKREIMRSKLMRGEKNWTPDQEYMRAISKEQQSKDFEFEYDDLEEDDFFDEDFEFNECDNSK